MDGWVDFGEDSSNGAWAGPAAAAPAVGPSLSAPLAPFNSIPAAAALVPAAGSSVGSFNSNSSSSAVRLPPPAPLAPAGRPESNSRAVKSSLNPFSNLDIFTGAAAAAAAPPQPMVARQAAPASAPRSPPPPPSYQITPTAVPMNMYPLGSTDLDDLVYGSSTLSLSATAAASVPSPPTAGPHLVSGSTPGLPSAAFKASSSSHNPFAGMTNHNPFASVLEAGSASPGRLSQVVLPASAEPPASAPDVFSHASLPAYKAPVSWTTSRAAPTAAAAVGVAATRTATAETAPSPPPPPAYSSVVPPPPAYSSVVPPQAPPAYSSVMPPGTAAAAMAVAGSGGRTRPPLAGLPSAAAAAAMAPPAAPSGLASGPASARSAARTKLMSHPDHQLCVDVRLPPLQPKDAAAPSLLATCGGNLFALPAGPGDSAMLQWSNADHELVIPLSCLRAREEDNDAAPSGSIPLPTGVSGHILCVCVDELASIMWTGHESGQVCQWSCCPGRAARYEQHWQAHNTGKVLGLGGTAWGDLWTASSTGNVTMWAFPPGVFDTPRPPVRVAVSQRPKFKLNKVAMASAGAHNRATHVVASRGGRVIWSSGNRTINLWAAHNGDYLGAIRANRGLDDFGRDPEEMSYIDVERGLDLASATAHFQSRRVLYQSLAEEAEVEAVQQAGPAGLFSAAAKFAAKLQQKVSKHLPVPVDTVRAQVVPGLAAAQSRGSIKAMVAALDGAILVAYKFGLIQKFAELGRLLWSAPLPSGALCMECVSNHLWVGGLDGRIRVLDLRTGEVLRDWAAHHHSVASIVWVGPLVYSLCQNGSLRGWSMAAPTEAQISAWQGGLPSSQRRHQLRVLTGTWNVNASRPSSNSLREWLGDRAQSSRADLVVVALQEVEIGASSVAVDAAYAYLFQQKLREKGNHNAKWWAQELLEALDPGQYSRVALRQMSGMLIFIFCRQELAPHVGEVVTSSVACGVLGVGGNKGGVAISFSAFRRRIITVCSHFAAHLERVDDRNADYAKIVRNLKFANAALLQQVRGAAQRQLVGGDSVLPTGDGATMVVGADGDLDIIAADEGPAPNTDGDSDGYTHQAPDSGDDAEDLEGEASGGDSRLRRRRSGSGGKGSRSNLAQAAARRAAAPVLSAMGPGLQDASLLVWAGDFNYRIADDYDRVVSRVAQHRLSDLLLLDQCRKEMERGNIFTGLTEGAITFPPTYKFDKNVAESATGGLPYDSSEKRRVPAWTDRIFFRGSLPGCDAPEEEVHASLRAPEAYGAVLSACDSDHKPVFAELDVDLPAYVQDQRRRMCFGVLTSGGAAQQGAGAAKAAGPALSLSTRMLSMRAGDPHPQALLLTNTGSAPQLVLLGGSGTGSSSWHLPSWLEVSPVAAVLGPGEHISVSLRAVQPEASQPASAPADSPGAYGQVQASDAVFRNASAHSSSAQPLAEVMLRVYSCTVGGDAGSFRYGQSAPGAAPLQLKIKVLP